MTRFALMLVAFVAALMGLGALDARACSLPPPVVRYYAARASGPQPLNGGVLVAFDSFRDPGDAGALNLVFDDAERPIAHELTPLRGYTSPEAAFLIRETAPPVPGSKRIYGGVGFPVPALALEYGDELDVTPPNLEGPIRMWVDRGHSSGGCFGGPFPGYVAEVQLPPANERAIVTIYATDRNGRDERLLRDLIAHPDRPSGARFDFSSELGRTVCLAFKTTDLAGNSTPLGQPCCADEKTASGPCQRIAAPPREYFIPEPDAGAGPSPAGPDRGGTSPSAGAGCSLSPRSRASAAWMWLAIVFGWVVRARRLRRLARPVAIAVAALLIIGCDGDDGGAPLQPIWGPDSRGLEIRCSAVFGGSSRFAANREQLTEVQLMAANALRARLTGRDDACVIDGASCLVDIVAADGGRTSFRAQYGSECDTSRLISWASLRPLLDALDCRLGAGEAGRPMRPNPYCEHGLYLTAADYPWVQVPEPGAHRLELATCGRLDAAAPPRMQLLDEAGAVVLEASKPADPGPEQLCLQMVHTFTQPGRFLVKTTGVRVEDLQRPTLRFTRVQE